nr:MAG TPA: hypothetical protein [Crassvirales sp.]
MVNSSYKGSPLFLFFILSYPNLLQPPVSLYLLSRSLFYIFF